LREQEDTITRDQHVLEKITEEVEDDDQGYVLLAQDDHEEDEEEPDEVESQEQEQSEVEGQQQENEVMAAVQDESLEFMDQAEDITAIDDDRLVSVVALDEMTIADDSGLHRDVEEEDGVNRVVEDEQDSRDVDIGVVLEEKRMLDSSVATPADVIEDSVMPISPVPCPDILTNPSHPDHNSISQHDGDVPEDTAEIGNSTAEEEHIFVPQGTFFMRCASLASCSISCQLVITITCFWLQYQKPILKMTTEQLRWTRTAKYQSEAIYANGNKMTMSFHFKIWQHLRSRFLHCQLQMICHCHWRF
jgi:hypothetical protein